MTWIEDAIDQYYNWLRENTYINTDTQTDWTAITTPFDGLYNDPIEIYVKKEGDTIYLSDDGATIENLELAGVNISRSAQRKEWLEYILLNYGIQLNNKELCATAKAKEFAQKKHNLLCAISDISDMEITSKHVISSMFRDEVKALLDEQEIIYTPQFIAKGNTGLEFTFDFQIAGRKKEILLKSFNSLNKTNVPSFLFGLDDIKTAREKISSKELLSVAVINDIDKDIKPEYLNAFESKNAEVIFWSGRNKPENLQKLRA